MTGVHSPFSTSNIQIYPSPLVSNNLAHDYFGKLQTNTLTPLGNIWGSSHNQMVPSKNVRVRRKPGPGTEHVKHRRTRSGCYTCRTRRVKCDETHPICERCRKGGRECVYPEPSVTSKSSASNLKSDAYNREGTSSAEEESDDDLKSLPDALPDALAEEAEEEDMVSESQSPGSTFNPFKQDGANRSKAKNQSSSRRRRLDRAIPGSSPLGDKSPSSSTEGSTAHSGSISGSSTSRTPNMGLTYLPGSEASDDRITRWSHLPKDLRFFLQYYRDNITNHHYFIKHDAHDFLRTTYLDIAVKNEPLLYAVVGFSSFHYTVAQPNGKIQDFLKFYNKSVSLLRLSLSKKQKHTAATLLTILQLATFEEYLGDWVNLLGHQKAAYEILTELYNPQSILQSPMHRIILDWYSRFDVFAGLMAGYETVLGREWFEACQQYYLEQIRIDPEDVNHKIYESIANLRVIAMDMSTLFARRSRESIGHDEFVAENDIIARRIADWLSDRHPSLRDPGYAVTSFEGAPPLDPDDIVNPYFPGVLFKGPLWAMNLVLIDWYAIDTMHRYQTALTLQCAPSAELTRIAYETCQLFEAIELYPGSRKGAIVATQASLAIVALFLPKDDRHVTWMRKKFARIEQLGYIFPITFRTKMAELWNTSDLRQHWYPPSDESAGSIIRSIRSFVDERTAPARDVPSQDITDMKAIFGSMKLDEGQSESSSASGQSSADFFAHHSAADSLEFGDRMFSASPGYWEH